MAGDAVRAAVAESGWGFFKLSGLFEQARHRGETDLSGALARILAAVGQVDIVVSALPAELVVQRLLELPFSDLRRLRRVVPFTLEEHLPFPVEGVTVAFSRVGREGANTVVMAACVRKGDLKSHLELLATVGLDPKTVTFAPLALAALVAQARDRQERGHLIVDLEENSTSIVLLDAAGRPRAIRTIAAGSIADGDGHLVSSPLDFALNAIRQTVLKHASQLGPPELIVTGPGAQVPGLRARLLGALGPEVHNEDTFDWSSVFNGFKPEAVRFASCIAMLLSERPTKPVEALNFRQDEFAFRGRIRGDFAPFYFSAILAAVAAGLAIVHFGLGVSTDLYRLSRLNREIAAVSQPVLGPLAADNAPARLSAGIAKMRRRLELMGGYAGSNAPLETLLALSRAVPAHIPVEVDEVDIDRLWLRISGEVDSFATVDQLKKTLEQTGYFGAIEVGHAKTGTNGAKVNFRLKAAVRGAVAATE